MKEAELSSTFSSPEDAEKFQALFAEQQQDIEKRIAAADTLPQEALRDYFSELNTTLQTLQRLYSNSSPYLRIYYRKIYQDVLQELQTRMQETEARLLPRKKFVFKGNRMKGKTEPAAQNGALQLGLKEKKVVDMVDGPNTCVYSDRMDAVIVIPSNNVTGKAVLLSRLRNCTVQMMGAPGTVHVADVTDCSISCGPVASSVFIEGARSCHFQLACQQLRVHETTDSDFHIHVTSKAIIEECRNVRFATYTFWYPTIDEDYKLAGLRKDINNWREVDDFNWLVTGQPSPNWSLLEPSAS